MVVFTVKIAPHQLVLQPTFTSACPLPCGIEMMVLSTHCGVRANRTAAVASSFNISMVTLYTVCVHWIVGGVSEISFILYRQVLVNVITGQVCC